ncbi:MAG: TIGR01459 family HAD-type hydrolase [Pseudomonadota bacterium]
MPKTKFCQGISDISDSYRAFLIDQWGTLHDGHKVNEAALTALKELRGRQKTVYLIANAPVRERENKDLLKRMGIGPTLYDAIITPAEVLAQELKTRNAAPFQGMGSKVFCFNQNGLQPYLESCGLTVVATMDDADFALITGTDRLLKPAPAWEEELRAALRRSLRLVSVTPEASALMMMDYMMGVGQILKRYAEMGGIVVHVGKPYKHIFQYCLNKLAAQDIFPAQTVMIGDHMGQDVFGAAQLGLDTCLLRAGSHWGAFRNAKTLAETDRILQGLILQFGNVVPTYLIDTFVWGRVLPDRKHRKRRELTPRRGRRVRRTDGSAETGTTGSHDV